MVAYAEEEPAFGIATVIIESSISFGDEDCSTGEAEQEQETNDDDDDNESSSTDNAAVERGTKILLYTVYIIQDC